MDNPNTFGAFLNTKRQEQKISLRRFAEMLKISPVYMCNMEKERNPAPSKDILERMASLLLLSDEDRSCFYDLAAKSKNAPAVSRDLPEYIMDRDIVRAALRTAKNMDATDEEWQTFISMLEAKRKKRQEEPE